MNLKRFSVTSVFLVVVTVGLLLGAFGLLIGRAQAPRARPTLVPTIDLPTPTGPGLPGSASMSGEVWHDLCALAGGEGGAPLSPSAGCVPDVDGGFTANGLLEAGEPGLAGVSVSLGSGACPSAGVAGAITNMEGRFTFAGLNAGTYCVSVDSLAADNALLLPGGWTFPAVSPDNSIASYTVTLAEGERRSELNFGWDYQFLPPPETVETPPAPTATPSGVEPTATATAASQPTATATVPTPAPACSNTAAFVADVTIPDNTYILPGQSFVKTWRLRNTGTCTWDTGYGLVFSGGSQLGGPAVVPLAKAVARGETVDVSVTLTAPTGNGVYESKWQLRSSAGELFGIGRNGDNPFWAKIIVGATPTPRPTLPTPTPTAVPSTSTWRGEYYANRDLAGTASVVRDDAEINFNWGFGSPATVLPGDGFSARWWRSLPLSAGTYRFYAKSDDGVRVWLNGELVIDQWHGAGNATYLAERSLGAGTHSLRVEYYENTGTAQILFWWERLGDFPQWRGVYYPNNGLSGEPTLVRNDVDVNFDWGRSAPASGLPSDRFSARWTRILPFDEGVYRFHVIMDDGARLYVDDALVINAWSTGARREVTGDYRAAPGWHTVRVEYFEDGGDASIQLWWEQVNVYADWKGEYWSNAGLTGNAALVRNDANIDFTWGLGSPATNIPADNFSARWTRALSFDAAIYRFNVIVDDGARLWVDNRLLIDGWQDGFARALSADLPLAAGQHSLRLEFFERTDNARVRLWWEKVSANSYPDWKGEYWSNANLSGSPALLRNDPTIDFRWGAGSAAPGLPGDRFSARWSRQANFEPGIYLFSASADDGIRFYLDGGLVLDAWQHRRADDIYTVEATLAGAHSLVVEYYEDGGQALARFWWKRIGDVPTPTAPPTVTSVPPTATPTATPVPLTATPTATPIPPTATSTATPVPPTVTPTATPIPPTVTPTETPVPPTATPTVTPLPPTATPTATPEPAPIRVVLNELLPVPGVVDWDKNGVVDAGDEWIELYNPGLAPVDLSSWTLEIVGGESYALPQGTVMKPGGLKLLYQLETGLLLNDLGGELQLLSPNGRVVDRVGYDGMAPDASYSRDDQGLWHADWVPTPGRPNRSAVPEASPGEAIAQ